MIITCVYENESFAREICDELQLRYMKHIRSLSWSRLGKKIETTDIVYKFIHHTELNERYRGHRTNQIYFEPSLIKSITKDQLWRAKLSLRREETAFRCLTLEEILEAFRGRNEQAEEE